MYRNTVKSVVVPSTNTLVDKEGYIVGQDGELTVADGDLGYGIVSEGHSANLASEVIVEADEAMAYVDGAYTAVAAEDPLTASGSTSGSASADGVLIKATIGTHKVCAYAKEAVTTLTKAKVTKRQ